MTRAKLYSISVSHPGHAARLMLVRKGIEHEVVDCLPGMQPLVVRAAGFRGRTVPALKLNGRRVQGSLDISRVLDELEPEPPLFPREPEARRAVEEAELWGERELQEIPRRFFRWGTRQADFRRWIAKEVAGMPAPGLMGWLNAPVGWYFRRLSSAYDERVRRDLAALPGLLDKVDSLIAEGVIGGEEANAADFQIGATVRVLLEFEDVRSKVEGRPAAGLARRLLPEFPGPVPRFLPPEWL